MSDEDDLDERYPDQNTLQDNACIGYVRGKLTLTIEGKVEASVPHDVSYRNELTGKDVPREPWDVVLKAFKDWCKSKAYYPDLYFINDHGNVDLLTSTGRIVRSWV